MRMISLTCNTDKQLSVPDINRLAQIIGIDEPINTDEFLSNPESERGFYEFFHDVLAGQKRRRVIVIDWKWEPSDLFWHIQSVLKNHEISLIQSGNSQAANVHTITFEINGTRYSLEVFDEHPERVLEYIDTLIDDGQFISIDFREDSYCWLYAPQSFGPKNLDEFCALTGCTISASDNVKLAPKKISINPKGKQSTKIFFKPQIQVIESGGGRELPVDWAGRVLPGQTLEEGIATELKEVYGYTGRFEFRNIYFLDHAKDRKGHDIERYGIYITLFPSETAAESQPEATIASKDSELMKIIDRYDGDPMDFESLDEIAHDFLMNDLADADNARRKDIAEEVKANIRKVEARMRELDPSYTHSIDEPMKVNDWNPPRDTSIEDFYEEFVYYFGNDESKVNEAATLYIKFHPGTTLESVKTNMLNIASKYSSGHRRQ